MQCTVYQQSIQRGLTLFFFFSQGNAKGVTHPMLLTLSVRSGQRFQKLIITALESDCQCRDCEKSKNH